MGPVLGANWRLACAKSFLLKKNNPDTASIHDSNAYEIERRVSYKGKSFTHHQPLVVVAASRFTFFARPGRVWFLRWFWEHGELQMLDVMLALANSVCLLALSRPVRHVRASLLCAWLVALCCAVVCCGRCLKTTCYALGTGCTFLWFEQIEAGKKTTCTNVVCTRSYN